MVSATLSGRDLRGGKELGGLLTEQAAGPEPRLED